MMGAALLDSEYRSALLATPFNAAVRLAIEGITWRTIATVAPAAALIEVEGPLYRPAPEEGGAAYVIPVRVDNPLSPEAADPIATKSTGEIVDLLAFHPAQPHRWALRTGVAEWLGAIEPQYLEPEPVQVWRSPLSWLRAGGKGLVLLSHSSTDRYRILSGCRCIIAEDAAHAAELRQVVSQPWPIPRVIEHLSQESRRAA